LPLARAARYTPPNKGTRMYFGVDYYPEHWVYPYAGTPEAPESRWERDVELMLDAGVNVVRMGEFAWGLYEPEEGKFNFGWMRRADGFVWQRGNQNRSRHSHRRAADLAREKSIWKFSRSMNAAM
jgi:hypothetical protein